MNPIEQLMRTAPVIPVLVNDDIANAKPLADALVKAGYPVLEVTLRTECALDAIKEMKQVEGAIVGAGTVTNPDELDAWCCQSNRNRSPIDAAIPYPSLLRPLVIATQPVRLSGGSCRFVCR